VSDSTHILEEILTEIVDVNPGLTLEKEYPFAKAYKRRWKADYSIFSAGRPVLLIEYEGLPGFNRKSRHTTRSGYSGDLEKYNFALEIGLPVLRYSMIQLENPDAVKNQIENTLMKLLGFKKLL
jgi:hypothetical protein